MFWWQNRLISLQKRHLRFRTSARFWTDKGASQLRRMTPSPKDSVPLPRTAPPLSQGRRGRVAISKVGSPTDKTIERWSQAAVRNTGSVEVGVGANGRSPRQGSWSHRQSNYTAIPTDLKYNTWILKIVAIFISVKCV